VSAVVTVVMLTIASTLGVLVRGDTQLAIDVRILETAQRVDTPWLDWLVRLSNAVFDTAGALVLAVLFIGAALLLHRPVFVLQLTVVMVLRLAGQVFKPIFDSPRPPEVHQPDPSLVSSTLGYPSGHAYTASVIATMLVLFVVSPGVSRWMRWTVTLAAVGAAGIAMFSRIAIGAHWPTDTIGGVLYGIATVALMQLVVGFLLERRTSGQGFGATTAP
jgi:membrane-associated phospholipid phosphatase